MGASRSGVGDRAVLSMGYAPADNAGAPWAVVFAAINPAHLSQLISHVQPPRHIELLLIHQAGIILN
jgi:hypothetical protein